MEKEVEGNVFADFAAELFVKALDNGAFPLAESSGPSGRYPKMWDLPSWQAILKRPDVASAVFPMCAFGLGPPDEPSAFYRHYTRVVFPSHGPLAHLLHRVCPGISSNHRHVPLKGCRPGVSVTRCTEAGAYPADFIKQIVQTLQASLTVLSAGGGYGWPPQSRAGGDVAGASKQANKQGNKQNQHTKKARKKRTNKQTSKQTSNANKANKQAHKENQKRKEKKKRKDKTRKEKERKEKKRREEKRREQKRTKHSKASKRAKKQARTQTHPG